ncbi:hypothetical protein BC938DRAFT_480184 [Jimgerdemannia flammicorona]|uniref:Uncharacterized protein n=1 Tax=Jimgerdemannia flammicorona TaxID=994334 RepID=A0A433QJ82_9FUNG|nr:hypothetical protein BC938DRAFT_480184 [Jimgerdemannia flammicorona]
MEVVHAGHHYGPAFRDTFPHVPPLASEFDASLDSLGPRVHGQDHVVPEVLGDVLGKTPEDVIVEGTRRERQLLGLLAESGHDFGVTVTLVHSAIRAEKVHVPPTFRIDDPDALCLCFKEGTGHTDVTAAEIVCAHWRAVVEMYSLMSAIRVLLVHDKG